MENQPSINMSSDNVTLNEPSRISDKNNDFVLTNDDMVSPFVKIEGGRAEAYDYSRINTRPQRNVSPAATIVKDYFDEVPNNDFVLTSDDMVSTIVKIDARSHEVYDFSRLNTRPPRNVSPAATIVKDELGEVLTNDFVLTNDEARRLEVCDFSRLNTRPPRNVSPAATIVKDYFDEVPNNDFVPTSDDMVSPIVKIDARSHEVYDFSRLNTRPPRNVSPAATIVKDELDEVLTNDFVPTNDEARRPEVCDFSRLNTRPPRNVSPAATIVKDYFDEVPNNDFVLTSDDMVSPIVKIDARSHEVYDFSRLNTRPPRNVSPAATIVKDELDDLKSHFVFTNDDNVSSIVKMEAMSPEAYKYRLTRPPRNASQTDVGVKYEFDEVLSGLDSIDSQEPMDIDIPINADEPMSSSVKREEKYSVILQKCGISFSGQSPPPEHPNRKCLRSLGKRSHKHGSDHRDRQEPLSLWKRSHKLSRKNEELPSESNSIGYNTKVKELPSPSKGNDASIRSSVSEHHKPIMKDYVWKHSAPLKGEQPKDEPKSVFERLIIDEKLRFFNESLNKGMDSNHIQEQKKKLFKCTELSIAEESEKKVTKIDKLIQKKKDDYIHNLFGTDNFDNWDNDPALSNVEISQKLKRYKSFVPADAPLIDKMTMKNEVNAARLTPIRHRNELVFHGQIKRIEIEFQGEMLPMALSSAIKEEKGIIADLVKKWIRPYYENGRIQPKTLFNDIVRKICHVFYEVPADENIVKTYIETLFQNIGTITNLDFGNLSYK